MNVSILLIFFIWILATALWWAFAFIQLPGPTPEWLTQAQDFCFGNTETGLPDAKGWMTLIVPSLFLFASLLTVFFGEIVKSLGVLLSRSMGRAIVLTVLAGLFIEAGLIANTVYKRWPSSGAEASASTTALPATYPVTEINISDFQLLNQNEKNFSPVDFKERKTILTFAFAHCDTMCPMIIKNSIKALDGLDQEEHQLVVITLDPWRDNPARLKSAAKNWNSPNNASFLSGSVEEVTRTLESLNVVYERNEKTGFVTHPALIYVLNKNGQIAYSFNNPSVRWIKEALERL